LAALLLISIAMLGVGIAASTSLMLRSGETRVGTLTLCFAFLATRQGIALWSSWDAPLRLDAIGAAEISVLAASGVGLWILAALWRTLSERDRAEALHWNSMEAVRNLGELSARPDLDLEAKLDTLLKTGCERFGLEIGAVSRVERQRYEVIRLRAPEGFPVSQGSVLLLADTYCSLALVSSRPAAFERIDDSDPRPHIDRASFGFGAYLGTCVRVFDEVVGTLCFGSRSPRKRRFTATDKDLLNLMSQWIGSEFERSLAAEERRANAARQATATRPPPDRARRNGAARARSSDVNAAIRRSEENLRTRIAPDIELTTRLADDLRPAVRLPVGIAAIVESLVVETALALSQGGGIVVETANLEIANADSDVIPAVAPDHYVNVTVRASGNGIDSESFARAFEPRDGANAEGRDLEKNLSIATIYRLLQRCGGGLSLEVEPGKGSAFTVFLPRADDAATRRRPALAPPV
jgi:GAF domain-containing protein